MESDDIKVLYFAGMRRSGSTILDNILNQIDGFLSIGEPHLIWHLLARDKQCRCGDRLSECALWGAVLEEAFGRHDMVNFGELAIQAERLRYKALTLKLAYHDPALAEYSKFVENLYKGISVVTNARVIVDSSKSPAYGFLLNSLPSLKIYVVQLTRDPRGVAFSVIRNRKQQGRGRRKRSGTLPTSAFGMGLEWSIVHSLCAPSVWLGRGNTVDHLLVRYEDVFHNPKASVSRIVDFAGETDHNLSFINGHKVQLGPTHTVAGNPGVASRRGEIGLRPDVAWISSMRPADKLVVTLATWPWLLKYNYPIVVRTNLTNEDNI